MTTLATWFPALLKRIGMPSAPPVTQHGLREFVLAFQQNISFENLDALADIAPSTHIDAIAEKMLTHGRGGWCYELNQLCGEALRHIGFGVTYRMARVGYRRPTFGPLTHLTIIVELDNQQWLVDVGFGGPGPTEPLRIEAGEHRSGKGARFFLTPGTYRELLVQRWIGENWLTLYEINPMNVLPSDLEMACHFVATWPNSPFRKQFMCVAHETSRSWTINGSELVQMDAHWNENNRTPIEDESDLQRILREVFKINAPTDVIRTSWQRVKSQIAN